MSPVVTWGLLAVLAVLAGVWIYYLGWGRHKVRGDDPMMPVARRGLAVGFLLSFAVLAVLGLVGLLAWIFD